ncbi:MAG: SPOR domain-containing protein [Bacillota bacterium]
MRREPGSSPRRRRGLRPKLPVAAFFVAFGLVAVFSGYFLGKFLVNALVASDLRLPGDSGQPVAGDAPAAAPTDKNVVHLPSISMHRLQLGVFSSPSNAQELAERVKSLNLPAGVVGQDPYRVVGGYFSTKEAGQRAAAQYTAKGFEVFVAPVDVGGGTLEVRGLPAEFEQALSAAFGEVGTVLEVESGLWDDLVLGQQAAVEVLSGLESGVRQANLDLSAVEPPSGWEMTHSMAKSLLDLALRNVVELKAYQEKADPSHYANAGVYFVQMVSAYEDLLNQAVMAAGS